MMLLFGILGATWHTITKGGSAGTRHAKRLLGFLLIMTLLLSVLFVLRHNKQEPEPSAPPPQLKPEWQMIWHEPEPQQAATPPVYWAPPLAAPELRAGWQRVEVPAVGTIDIPPVMEVQVPAYRELRNALVKHRYGHEASSSGVTIQQKGLNVADPNALRLYVRVMVETEEVPPGEAAALWEPLALTDTDLNELKHTWEAQMREIPGVEVLEFHPVTAERINGIEALCMSYRRRVAKNPPCVVKMYMFQNYDRMHRLTMSYAESEESRWVGYFPGILASFRITAIRRAGSTGGAVAVRASPSGATLGRHSQVGQPSPSKTRSHGAGDTYVDTQYGFSIRFPEGWQVKKALSPDRNIVIKAIHRDEQRRFATLIIYAWDKEDAVIDIGTATPKELFQASYGDRAELVSSGETSLNGKRALWIVTKFDSPFLDYGISYVVAHKDKVFCLFGQTALGGFEWYKKNEPVLLGAIKTFRSQD